MKVLVLGASGQVGSVLTEAALERGHIVVGVTRSSSSRILEKLGGQLVNGDAYDAEFLTGIINSFKPDVVVSATRPSKGREAELVRGTLSVASVCAEKGVWLVVSGGAGALPVSDEPNAERVVDSGYVEDAWRDIARASADQFDALVDIFPRGRWTYVAPPSRLVEGERVGRVRKSNTALVSNEQGVSELTWLDYAGLILEEVEKPSGERLVTGGY
ncbi:GDP-mannose 4,6-dehydratase [Corynebacterium glaucum]|uniref:GDP-mannose 4,6-dehydratase n=1 Tax=Corynebacterium glaucum TaxID=187491 RepID=A0A1Q2HYL1_9CORY|nr:NAD-dependent epimerase/dehydratase family protein [Corynebacterium glaucum]AQQ15947.1 GDP-mannose 4,6-dehydratase [Corynebacterium glaucum]WJZ08430.1 GDP-mannose 4,6-dehydratase [Corynebacterium glaucum]